MNLSSMLDDTMTTFRVKTSLLREAGFTGLTMGVATHHGVVYLSGKITSYGDIVAAMAIARGVVGVRSVQNGCQLRHA
ncbi:MAG TPA: BON domain-containing protein [Methylovorus sp.]|jgi:hyperosmotically inducible periplasmic protein|nr:BON domain-containing protein [Methylovorus sp.]